MATYEAELLNAAEHLLLRQKGRRGPLPGARVRRSISTTYYALFHFMLDEAARRLIGTQTGLARRRRILARSLTHAGVKTTFNKLRLERLDSTLSEFLKSASKQHIPVEIPRFAKYFASVFIEAQTMRHDADYDMNKPLSERDAKIIWARATRAIRLWKDANSTAEADFKHAICILMLVKGSLRQDREA